MALYEYHCENCETDFELRRPIRESDAAAECPNCTSDQVSRRVSLFISFTKGQDSPQMGGCGCGGQCSCGNHSLN